jgi:hypothetical protein
VIDDEAKIRYEVEEDIVQPEPTIKEAIERAIRQEGGRANLKTIYETVQKLKKFESKTPLESIRSDLSRGAEEGRFVRNSDGTYSLGTKAGLTFKEYVSTLTPSSNGVIIDGRILAPYHPKEDELEKDFIQNYREIFGPQALYIPVKKLIGAKVKKVTDGLMLEVDEKDRPRFSIVEVELGSHDLESHVQAQVLGFLRALKDEKSVRILVHTVNDFIDNMASTVDGMDWAMDFFAGPSSKMHPKMLQPYQYLDSLLHNRAGVIIVIDEVRSELADIVDTISKLGTVRVVEFKTFKRNEAKVYTFSHVDMNRLA